MSVVSKKMDGDAVSYPSVLLTSQASLTWNVLETTALSSNPSLKNKSHSISFDKKAFSHGQNLGS